MLTIFEDNKYVGYRQLTIPEESWIFKKWLGFFFDRCSLITATVCAKKN